MADYNVNMKQWNGSSFDNVLPLAFNSKALEGKSYDDIIQYVQNNDLVWFSGRYEGTNTSGSNNRQSLVFPFAPILFITPSEMHGETGSMCLNCDYLTNNDKTAAISFTSNGIATVKMSKSMDGKTISWYGSSPANQQNAVNTTYYYIAIGGFNPAFETTIVKSGSFEIQQSGKYYMELYGGGGGGSKTSPSSTKKGSSGGSSCQSYENVIFTKGEIVDVVIGTGGKAGTTADPSGGDGTQTKFGSYVVNGGGGSSADVLGKGAGNLGKDGVSESTTKNKSNGTYSNLYGYGGSGYASASSIATAGGSGAVYLKYLGE